MSQEWQDYLKDPRTICKYGMKCYQKNPEHHGTFKHPPQQLKRKAVNKKRDNARFNPYARKEDAGKKRNLDTGNEDGPSQSEVRDIKDVKEEDEQIDSKKSDVDTCASEQPSTGISEKTDDKDKLPINLNENTVYFDKDTDHTTFKKCFLVDMPQDFFKFFECLSSEGPIEKLLSSVNLQLIGPFELLLGNLPILDDKDKYLYLIHWRFFYDPPEFQAVLKKKGKSEFHIGYFRDSPDEEPVFLAANNSEKDFTIKPVAKNIFGATYWYLKQEKKTSPFVSVACQKLMDKINKWAKENDYTLEEYNMKDRQSKIVCKSFHGAGIIVPYNRKTQLGYRSLAETDKNIKKIFKKLVDAKTQPEKDKLLSEIQPVITYANIAVDECDFGTGLEAGIALLCSGLKELEPSALNCLRSAYSLLNRDAFRKIIQAHLKHRRKGPNMSIVNSRE